VNRRISAMAMNTFRETVRDRVFYLVAVFGFVMLSSTAVLSPLTVGAQAKVISDVGLAAMIVFGLVVVVFVGSGMVRKEMDKGTIVTILAKPVGRREYLLGKFLGLNMTVMFLVLLLVAPGAFSLRYLPVIYLGFLELTLMNAVTVFFSTCVSPILAAVFTLGAFIVGHLSQSIRDFGQLDGGQASKVMTNIVYYLTPNLEVFNVRGAVVHGETVDPVHVGLATLYAVGWTIILLVIAGSVFARRELK
jgi:Cu-processing system permease protein